MMNDCSEKTKFANAKTPRREETTKQSPNTVLVLCQQETASAEEHRLAVTVVNTDKVY